MVVHVAVKSKLVTEFDYKKQTPRENRLHKKTQGFGTYSNKMWGKVKSTMWQSVIKPKRKKRAINTIKQLRT